MAKSFIGCLKEQQFVEILKKTLRNSIFEQCCKNNTKGYRLGLIEGISMINFDYIHFIFFGLRGQQWALNPKHIAPSCSTGYLIYCVHVMIDYHLDLEGTALLSDKKKKATILTSPTNALYRFLEHKVKNDPM